tara:strand:- start:28 stop:765 length:738 start_codon:yes stop_codon:yes gene_type:complete
MNIPQKRNEFGLTEGVIHAYHEDGTINWRAMIAPEHLYPNKGWFESRSKPMPNSIEGLEDSQLLIKLSGIKELAKLRGFTNIKYEIIKCNLDHVAVKCEIDWIPNFESNDAPVHFEDVASATVYNTNSFAQKFLETIATNRAFVRCVRNFLNIHIVGADEIYDSKKVATNIHHEEEKEVSLPSSQDMLEKVAISNGIESFDDFIEHLRKLYRSKTYVNDDAGSWTCYSEVPAKEARTILAILKND